MKEGETPGRDLRSVDQSASLTDKVLLLHEVIGERINCAERIAVAIYDPATDVIKTFLASEKNAPALSHYETKLGDVPSLAELAKSGCPRVVDDLSIYADSTREHTRRLLAAGYRSSYTVPMYGDGVFCGFVFVDSRQTGAFSADVRARLEPLVRLIAMAVVCEFRLIRTLTAATKTARYITSRRDCETGAHLERMSRYCRLVAREIAPRNGLKDDYVEHVFLFAPLHDIGKIGIPDSILLKPASLTGEEYALMKTHTSKGVEIVDYMLNEFGLRGIAHIDVLRNIVLFHHEAFDGSGYPKGLKGDAIPLEARITTVADVFDALTSRRPYKDAWPVDATFDELKRVAGSKLDPQCVETLLNHREEIESIRATFKETVYD